MFWDKHKKTGVDVWPDVCSTHLIKQGSRMTYPCHYAYGIVLECLRMTLKCFPVQLNSRSGSLRMIFGRCAYLHTFMFQAAPQHLHDR